MNKKKVGRPTIPAKEKKVPLTIMVKPRHRKELQEMFKKIANERSNDPIKNNS
jgi:hypothetical protein